MGTSESCGSRALAFAVATFLLKYPGQNIFSCLIVHAANREKAGVLFQQAGYRVWQQLQRLFHPIASAAPGLSFYSHPPRPSKREGVVGFLWPLRGGHLFEVELGGRSNLS